MNKLQECYRQLNSGNFKAAVKTANVMLKKSNVDRNVVLSLKALSLSRMNHGAEAYETLREITADCIPTLSTIRMSYSHIQRVPESIDFFETVYAAATKQDEKEAALTSILQACIAAEDYSKAQSALKRLFTITKDPATVVNCLVLQLADADDARAATVAPILVSMLERLPKQTQESVRLVVDLLTAIGNPDDALAFLEKHAAVVETPGLLDTIRAPLLSVDSRVDLQAAIANRGGWEIAWDLVQTAEGRVAILAHVGDGVGLTPALLRCLVHAATGTPSALSDAFPAVLDLAPSRPSLTLDVDPILELCMTHPTPTRTELFAAMLDAPAPTPTLQVTDTVLAKIAVVGSRCGAVADDALAPHLAKLDEITSTLTPETELAAIILAAARPDSAVTLLESQLAVNESGAVKAAILSHLAATDRFVPEAVNRLSLHHHQHDSITGHYVLMPSLRSGSHAGVKSAVEDMIAFRQEYEGDWARELSEAVSNRCYHAAMQFIWMHYRVTASVYQLLAHALAFPLMLLGPPAPAEVQFRFETVTKAVRAALARPTLVDNSDVAVLAEAVGLLRTHVTHPPPPDTPTLPRAVAIAPPPAEGVAVDINDVRRLAKSVDAVYSLLIGESAEFPPAGGVAPLEVGGWLGEWFESARVYIDGGEVPVCPVPDYLSFIDCCFTVPLAIVIYKAIVMRRPTPTPTPASKGKGKGKGKGKPKQAKKPVDSLAAVRVALTELAGRAGGDAPDMAVAAGV